MNRNLPERRPHRHGERRSAHGLAAKSGAIPMDANRMYTVNVATGEVVEAWGRTDGAWFKTLAATAAEARDFVTRDHLAEARSAWALEARAPFQMRGLHTLEQARAWLLGHALGCDRHDLEARNCGCRRTRPKSRG